MKYRKYNLFFFSLLILSIWIGSLLLLATSASAATFYVAPDKNLDGTPNTQGSDTYSGTLTQPFKTFSRSWQAMQPGDTLYLLDGIFLQSYTPTVGGTAAAAITTKALN